MSYRVRKGLSYSQTRWKPFKYGLCPSCEAEELKKQPPPLPVGKPPEKPPPVQEIREPTPKGKKQGEGKGKKKPEEEKDEEKREQEERPKEEQKEKQEEQPKPKPGKEEEKPKPDLPFGAKTADLEKAKKGSDEVKEEFEKAKQVREDTTTPMFQPVGAVSAPSVYKDQSFITKMREELKDWQVGYKEKVGKRGRSLKVGEYIRSMGERPFVSRTKTSAKGQKILVVVDFSGSMMPQEEEYKKALISSMTVLDSIGTKTALFGFGTEKGAIEPFFFKVKKFEDSKWTDRNSARIAALEARYPSTPTSRAYRGLEKYIKQQRPDVVLTITDGEPDDEEETKEMVQKLKKKSKMVAFGLGDTPADANIMAGKLKQFGYNDVVAVSSLRKLPKKLVDLMAPT